MSTLAVPQTATTTWNIDPAHSVAEFKVKHMMISNVKGQFPKVTGVLTLDESDLTNSRVEAVIEAASIETRDAQRDAHLKSADFFHVEKFPSLVLQVHGHQPCPGRRTGRRGRPNHSGRHPQGALFRGRANPADEGSLGRYPSCGIGDHKDQPQRLRLDLERGARDRWHSGWRRGDHHARRGISESLNYPPRHTSNPCAGWHRKGKYVTPTS